MVIALGNFCHTNHILSSAGRNDTDVQQEIMVGISAGNGLNISVYVEGNTTTTADLGVVVFGDVDQNDTVHFFNKTVVDNGMISTATFYFCPMLSFLC